MRSEIIKKLKEIEKKENVKILYAVESGSRAWGFESKDSDYDIRFIYVRSSDWYLTIKDKRDVLEYPIDNLLDISGWDLKKALQLLYKSNPPLFEWLNSPYIYTEDKNFTREIKKLSNDYYSPISSTYHYLRMAEGNYRGYLKKDKVRIKKYFYVLRPIFACMWIEKYQSQPPMEFSKVFEDANVDKEVRLEIEKLLSRKRKGEELDREKRIDLLNQYIEEKLEYFNKIAKEQLSATKDKSEKLDNLFRNLVLK